jgi:hypothetical protein
MIQDGEELWKDLKPVVEPGKFNVMIGGNSVDLVSASFKVTE